ncbi:MAG TPA: hypothetical protein VNG29_00245 [Candidatus Paceibacterota bacterium]|nr:hypothetical protein [Candidatus Paceibacterota bacterium]
MPEAKEYAVKTITEQMNFVFLQGMSNRMDVSCFKYGDYKSNYAGTYTEPFRKQLSVSLRKLVVEWKGKGTSANGNAIMFAIERLLLYVDGGKVKDGIVPCGNTEYLMDAANGLMIEFTCPQVPGAAFAATDDNKSPGFSGLSEQEIKDFKAEHPEE